MKTIILSANVSWYIFNFRKNTVLKLLKMGYEVIIISSEDAYTERLKLLGCKFIPLKVHSGSTNPLKDMVTIFRLIFIYKKIKPNLVLNFTPKMNIYGTVATWLNGIPCINNVAGLGSVFVKEGIITRIVRLLYKVSLPKASFIFFQNKDDYALLSKSIPLNKSKVDFVPGSGVDISRFRVVKTSNNSVIRFIFIGRLLYEKGVETYVDAAKRIKTKYHNTEFRLLGFEDSANPSAIEKEKLMKWVKEGTINYLGSSDKVENEISKIDCVVLPSYYREGVPKSLLEGSAMGKILIASDITGCREVIEEGKNGFLHIPKNVDDLVKKIDLVINMSVSDRIQMGLYGRKKIETQFSEDIVINKYMKQINILIQN